MTTIILKIAIHAPIRHLLDYLPPLHHSLNEFRPGVRVRIPFRNRQTIGILMAVTHQTNLSSARLKYAIEIIDEEPILPESLLVLIQKASLYYHHPIGEILKNTLPVLVRQGRPITTQALNMDDVQENHLINSAVLPSLNFSQEDAVKTVCQVLGQFQVFLLNGVTGSGKTEVYLRVIESVLQQGKQALVLVPEIGLTPQTVQRFQNRFNLPCIVLHSNLTERERLNAWVLAKNNLTSIVIGTRSAILAPMPNLGVVIVDEEHDTSYKQQDGFRYSARDLAVMRAQLESIPIILGTATPSLESQYNVLQGRYHELNLPMRAGNATQPTIKLVDIRNEKLPGGLSNALLEGIKQHLDNGKQVLLFLNRRGFAPILICHHCGWVANCDRCDAALTLHQSPYVLHCHHCNSIREVETHCSACNSLELVAVGLGTERIEKTLKKSFPHANIARMDRDSTRRKGSLQSLLETMHTGQNNIFIGTQMLAKGHHFPNVTLAAIIDADSGFLSSDMRASERIGQLIMQVSGRSGRADTQGEVIIQTRHPNHPLLHKLIHEGYKSFSTALLAERKQAGLAPYSYMALLRAEAHSQEEPLTFLTEICALTKQHFSQHLSIFGPVPAPVARKAGRFRAQLLLQSFNRRVLHESITQLLNHMEQLKSKNKIRWSIDVDPIDLF